MINAPYCHVPQREHAPPSRGERGEGIDMEEMTTRLSHIRRVPSRAFISGLLQNWISTRLNRMNRGLLYVDLASANENGSSVDNQSE